MSRNRSTRKEEAKVRNEAFAKLTTQQKIEHLNTVLGVDKGAVKQRNKLSLQLERQK